MIRIKLFKESFDKSHFYFKISNDDYTLSNSKVVSISDECIEMISSLGIDVIIKPKSIVILSQGDYVYISELEDEWFEVYYKFEFYRCDQLEGLKEFLKDKEII